MSRYAQEFTMVASQIGCLIVILASADVVVAEDDQASLQKKVADLIEATKNKNKEVRQAALAALVRFDPSPEKVAPALRDVATHDPDLNVRIKAIQSLEEIAAEDHQTIQVLEALLTHQSREIRRAAVRALGSIGLEAKSASRSLMACCNDPSIDIVHAAASFLARINTRQREFAVSALIAKLKTERGSVDRFAAAEALGEIGPAARTAVPSLIDLLTDEVTIRCNAARALGRIGPSAKDSVPALLRLLQTDDDPYKEASSWAAWALPKIEPNDEKVRRAVIHFLTDFVADGKQADWMRRNAAHGLELYGENARSAIPALRKALEDKTPTVRVAAVQALARIGDDVKETMPMLIRAVKDRDVRDGEFYFPDTNGDAAEALGVIGPPAKDAIPALTQALKRKEVLLPGQIQIALALITIDPKGQTEVALDALEKLIKGDYAKGAEDAAKALVELGPKAVPILNQMLNDERRGRRRAAANALEKLGRKAEPALVMLRKVRDDRRATVRRAVIEACGKIDAAATRDILLEALQDPAWSVREAAVRALAKDTKPTKEVIAALLATLKDKDPDVHDVAAEVIKEINPSANAKP